MSECDGFHRSCDSVNVSDYTMGKHGMSVRRAVSLCFACAKAAQAHGYDLRAVGIVFVDSPAAAVQR